MQALVEEVEEVLRLSVTAAHPEGKGVALHTPLLHGGSYRYVLLWASPRAASLPSIADDPALDFHERRRLGNGDASGAR